MLSPQYPNSLLLVSTLRIGEFQKTDLVASQGLPQTSDPNLTVKSSVLQLLRDEGAEIAEGIGNRVAEVDDVPIVVEPILEGKSVVRTFAAFFLEFSVLPIVELGSISDPPDLPPLEPHHRKH